MKTVPKRITHYPHPFHIIGECEPCCEQSEALRAGYDGPLDTDCSDEKCVNYNPDAVLPELPDPMQVSILDDEPTPEIHQRQHPKFVGGCFACIDRAKEVRNMFDGETYDPALDENRLSKQLGRVWAAMKDGEWRTLSEIAEETGDESQAAISARLRDLRKPRFGGYNVLRRRRTEGLWEYALIIDQQQKETSNAS